MQSIFHILRNNINGCLSHTQGSTSLVVLFPFSHGMNYSQQGHYWCFEKQAEE